MSRYTEERYKKILEQRHKNIEKNAINDRKFPEIGEVEPLLTQKTNLSELTPEARQAILNRQIKGQKGSASLGGLAGLAGLAGLGYLVDKTPDLQMDIKDAGEGSDIIPEDEQLDPRFKKMKELMNK